MSYIFIRRRSRITQLNMKLMVAVCLLAVAAAAPPPSSESSNEVQLLRYDKTLNEDGKLYNFRFEQSDGQTREEQGEQKSSGLAVTGSFHWVGPDGVEYLIKYTADENGYQPDIQQGPGGAVSPQVASLLG